MKALTPDVVRYAVIDTVRDVIEDYRDEPETDREAVIQRLDEETETLFVQLVRVQCRFDQYSVQDLIKTAQPCGVILQVATEDAWEETDSGLWEGLTNGILASMAYASLRILLYVALRKEGHDTNDDRPFERTE